MEVLGIDIGGSGIKGAIVNTDTGEFVSDRYRIETPKPATPKEITASIKKITAFFNWKGKVGCGFPAVIQSGVIKTAANIDKSCIGANANKIFSKATNCKVKVFNDADAAGFAELTFSEVKNQKGLTIFLTIGTGIGSALFKDGMLIPNTELGHIYMKNGLVGEKYTSDATRKEKDLDWKAWSNHFDEYLKYLEKLFYPDLFIIGGGISKKLDKISPFLTIKTKFKPAKLLNNAGIIGAALLAK
ncbi:MAG: polyphosphate glucokinase [Bacteroidetes bacterium GWF2_33_16]|nr:MAG: polyphosphate glucokinase [Bacteroidetes bacterium GWE2_32_14]OFY03473.1 MAG: polyphosphate glucokinase [Bacteroidetes bacterium GWF2_33_16]